MNQSPVFEHATIAELLLARRRDENPGLLFEDASWTWDDCVHEAAVRSELLQSWRDPERPFHVGVLLDNVPEYLLLILGASLAGATVVGINSTRRGAELAADIRGTDVDVIVTSTEHLGLLDGIDHGARSIHLVDSPEWQDLLAAHAGAEPVPTQAALDPTTTLLLLFTSGSTGRPKAVICSTGRWAFICQVNPFPFASDDVAYNAMPLFHGNALMGAYALCLNHGAAFALRRKFSASGFLPDVQKFGATFFNYVGRSLAYVLAQPERVEESDNRLRAAFGTEASAQDRAEFLRRFGCAVVEAYGSSEGVCNITSTAQTPQGALGKPQQGQFPEILRADGQVADVAQFDAQGILLNPREAIGELVARGAAPGFEGYYKNPEASQEKIRGDDFWTGDLAYVDAEGFFWFAGRTSDWLRVDSENIAAAPIERILNRYPGVAVAAVYPVPDPQTGDRVMAALQVTDAEFEAFDTDSFREFLDTQEDLGTKWAPSLVRVTRNLPVTATRKVDKPSLRRLLWQGPDPVFERIEGSYHLLDDTRREQLAALFATHGRENAQQV